MELPGGQGVVSLRQFETPPAAGTDLELLVTKFDADEGLYELSLPTAAVAVGNWDDVGRGADRRSDGHRQQQGRAGMPDRRLARFHSARPVVDLSRRAPGGLRRPASGVRRDRGEPRPAEPGAQSPSGDGTGARARSATSCSPNWRRGKSAKGVVRSIKDFGAFVDLGGADGLMHISQLSWDRVNHPSEVLEVGQKVKVRVEKFDKETARSACRTARSARTLGTKRRRSIMSATGDRRRFRLMEFGAFVKLEPGVEGSIHVSELAHGRVWRPSDVVSEGQEVEVKVLSVDAEQQRIGLSLKALAGPAGEAGPRETGRRRLRPAAGCSQVPAENESAAQGRHRKILRRRTVWIELVTPPHKAATAGRGKYASC